MSKISPRLLSKEEKGITQGEWQGGEELWHSQKTRADVEGEFVTRPLYTALTHSQPHLYSCKSCIAQDTAKNHNSVC